MEDASLPVERREKERTGIWGEKKSSNSEARWILCERGKKEDGPSRWAGGEERWGEGPYVSM